MATDPQLDSKVEEDGLNAEEKAIQSSSSSLTDREAFLSSFTAEEDRKIMRKVDKRFLLLIGLMYILKNVDYINAATVKVLQVKQPRNILIELDMTADEYNWVQSIYFVSYLIRCLPDSWPDLWCTDLTANPSRSRILCSRSLPTSSSRR
jgi:hypothetical protein